MVNSMNQMKPYVPIGIAALRLGISDTQVKRLIASAQLEPVFEFGARFVSVESIASRQRTMLRRKRKQSTLQPRCDEVLP
jgi:hypothetical protein